MMRTFIAAGAMAQVASAFWPDPAPSATDAVAMKLLGDAEGWTPVPTTAPLRRDMLRRQAATQILGYVRTHQLFPGLDICSHQALARPRQYMRLRSRPNRRHQDLRNIRQLRRRPRHRRLLHHGLLRRRRVYHARCMLQLRRPRQLRPGLPAGPEHSQVLADELPVLLPLLRARDEHGLLQLRLSDYVCVPGV